MISGQRCLLICLFLLATTAHAATPPTIERFTKVYKENLDLLLQQQGLFNIDLCDPAADLSQVLSEPQQAYYNPSQISLAEFCATQSNYSFFKVNQELSKDTASSKTVYYVLYRGHRYLVDGHHHVLLALYRGDSTISAKMVKKYDDRLSPEKFLEELHLSNHIYDELTDFHDIINDIYLNKVRGLIRDTTAENGKLVVKGKKTRGTIIGALVPSKPYYAEQGPADILRSSGLHTRNMTSEKTLEILQQAQKKSDPRASHLILLDQPMEIKDEASHEKASEQIRKKAKSRIPVVNLSQCGEHLGS